MDELLLKQLVRQLKIMNIWISVFGTMIVVTLVVLGVLVFKVVSFVNDTNKKIDTIGTQAKQSLDFKQKACDSNALGSLLQSKTDICTN
jgi:hypothetical protein